MVDKTRFYFKGLIVNDLGKRGIQGKTTISYPFDFLEDYLKRMEGKRVKLIIIIEEVTAND